MMKILTAEQIKDADQYTIKYEPIASLDLMERASVALSEEIKKITAKDSPLFFFIGKGNNGGDGLAIARILSLQGYSCTVCCVFDKEKFSDESRINFQRLPQTVDVWSLDKLGDIQLDEKTVLIDAVLGSGVKGGIKEPIASVIETINKLPNLTIAIDLPSGMSTEWQGQTSLIVKADYTLTIEFPKLGMLLANVGECCGNIIVVPIGLSAEYIEEAKTNYFYSDKPFIRSLFKKRESFAHKNKYGHTLLICGSKSMSGAAVLATGSALRSGCGLVTIHLPSEARYGVAVNYPSAMLSLDDGDCFTQQPKDLNKYSSIGVGCGLGQAEVTVKAFEQLLRVASCSLVIDADALNILAANQSLMTLIPKDSVLTPHLGELRRLVGDWQSEEEKIMKVRKLAMVLSSTIVVKGAHTMVCLPNGACYFNSTGNAGMAKGGSGDVLTGLLTGLIARGYPSSEAAIIAVYLHGLAGDLAAMKLGMEAMMSSDLIDFLPDAFVEIFGK